MPRTTHQLRVRVFLPATTLARLAQLAALDEAPLAEVFRRLADLAVTFDFPPPSITIAPDHSPSTPFTIHIPEPLLQRFQARAAIRGQTLDDLLFAVVTVYLAKRARADADISQAA